MQTARYKKIDLANFGQRLRTLRRAAGLTQVQFGELGGVGRMTQLMYEAGDRYPDLEYLQRLGDRGIDIGSLLGAEEVPGEWLHVRAEVLWLIDDVLTKMSIDPIERRRLFKALVVAFNGREEPATLEQVSAATKMLLERSA